MPIKTQNDLPAKEILENENIFVMDEFRAVHQDMRPLQVLILNNMPVKQDTELQLLRALSNTPLQVDVTFMNTKTHVSLNTPASHLNKFYTTFDEIRDRKFDGLIVTGAPVEDITFEEVGLLGGDLPDPGLGGDPCDLHLTYLLGGTGRILSLLRNQQETTVPEAVRRLCT